MTREAVSFARRASPFRASVLLSYFGTLSVAIYPDALYACAAAQLVCRTASTPVAARVGISYIIVRFRRRGLRMEVVNRRKSAAAIRLELAWRAVPILIHDSKLG